MNLLMSNTVVPPLTASVLVLSHLHPALMSFHPHTEMCVFCGLLACYITMLPIVIDR